MQYLMLCHSYAQSRRPRVGAGNGSNLAVLYSHPQRQEQRRRGDAVVVRASELAVKEESGTPSLGLEVVETVEPNSRVFPSLTVILSFNILISFAYFMIIGTFLQTAFYLSYLGVLRT